ncbi:hypothetical protein VPH35_038108 [Triticum aestivum]|uniref:Uncharacterized protein n=1 Tax=Aegilops tauschii subsp. strangulata TaxID=200361 RepID=A0A453C6K4_AEGTS
MHPAMIAHSNILKTKFGFRIQSVALKDLLQLRSAPLYLCELTTAQSDGAKYPGPHHTSVQAYTRRTLEEPVTAEPLTHAIPVSTISLFPRPLDPPPHQCFLK